MRANLGNISARPEIFLKLSIRSAALSREESAFLFLPRSLNRGANRRTRLRHPSGSTSSPLTLQVEFH
jgi:hypothetical protein